MNEDEVNESNLEATDEKVTHVDLPRDSEPAPTAGGMRSVAILSIVAVLILVGGIVIGSMLGGDEASNEVEDTNDTASQVDSPNQVDEESAVTLASIQKEVENAALLWGADQQAFLEAATADSSTVSYVFTDDTISVTSTGIPEHSTGAFPNPNNPNSISEQQFSYTIPRTPVYTGTPTTIRTSGFTLGGIPMEPGTAERDQASGWSIEAFNASGVFNAGTDDNNAHVQPNGTYHYHAIPSVLDTGSETEHSVLVAIAPDGFPIYSSHGYVDPTDPTSGIKHLESSWQLKSGFRVTGEPGGSYNGDYTNDFEFVEGSGDLDECNGRFTVTPEFPNGTYAYFMTEEFPFIHRCVMGGVITNFDNANGNTAGNGLQQGPPQGGPQGPLQ